MGTRLSSWMILLFINGTFANFLDPPTIIPDASYISLQQYSDFDIKCVSEYPITWTTFEAFDGRYQISGTKNKTHYENTIHLLNITHDYVGFFFCVAEIKEFEYGNSLYFVVEHRYHSQMSGLNSIYVFVNDFSQILARQQETIIFRNEYLVVPCKPAMSSVHVKLFLDNAEVFAEYYKTIGFIIKINDSTDYYDKTFICTTSPPIDKNYQNITFRVTHNIPKLQPTTGFYLTMGEQMNLTCSVDILHDEDFQIDWYFGNVELKNNRLTIGKKRENHPTRNDLQKGISYVKIDKVIRADEGNYRCKSPQHHEYGQYAESSDPLYITILEQGDNSIEIRPSMILYDMYMVVNSYEQEAVWKCKIKGKPTPKLVWYDNTGRVIEESEKYEMTTYQELATLKINQIGFMDSGKYKLKADDVERTFDLVVNEAPYVEVRGPQSIINKNETVEFICYASGYPPSTITWTFTPCSTVPMWPSCEATSFSMKGELSQTELPQLYTQQSILKFTATEAGKVECTAVNSQGKIKSEALLKVSDIEDDFCIFGSNKNFQVGIGDNITLTCAASMYIYSDVQWYFRGAIVSADEVQNDTEASYRKTITWNGIQTTHSGSYECRSTKYPGILSQLETKIVNIDVREPRKPEIKGKIFDELYVPQGTNRDITCDFVDTTFPNPTITWHKNGTLISSSTSNVFSDDNKILTILKVSREDEGLITCTVENRLGKAEKSIVLKINDMSGAVPAWPIILGVTVIFIICFAFFYFRYRRLQNELKTAKIIDFDDGNPEGLNPDLALHEQADLLPYNKRYEFPRDKLKLGKQLGAGAFGVVTKAVATGILPYEEETIVAVKMLQKTADNLEVRALVTELKIMANLGQHLNVVNLLGAVTKNIERREVMVIVEYCQYGNLQNFLIKQRQNFINQINTQTGCIDPTILTKRECNESENGSSGTYLANRKIRCNMTVRAQPRQQCIE
ncbi:Vascular endothelial growth factor receptor 1 [Pseudolycoriella hygida]|uniref:Vascular endothelial growth factor receptor 1 n=1 Tax=Pseudolycoriella hygida TaxID=35572 RepID=A0A9Q0N2K4_9DIPT|nr:Vascular endothelial growth factor receptor 1 [Pseudolycoriella hygida]